MKHDRLSIHISDDAEITVDERKNGVKKVKNISLNDLLICIKSCIKEIKPVYRAVLPKNAMFYSCSPETGDFSAVTEYPYSKADITYMDTVYRDFPLPKLVFGFKVSGTGKIQKSIFRRYRKRYTAGKYANVYLPVFKCLQYLFPLHGKQFTAGN